MESSALTAANVETAFVRLITRINEHVQSGHFHDRLESFNYFGSAKIKNQYLQQTQSSQGLPLYE